MKIPRNPPDFHSLCENVDVPLTTIMAKVPSVMHHGRYMHWDEIRRRPTPDELTHDDLWLGLKWRRLSQYKAIPLGDKQNTPFVFAVPEQASALLHEITQKTSGVMGAPEQVTNPATQRQYLVRNLMEEGITSSLIEGAATTRQDAKRMLRSGRPPQNEAERMVANNYAAMQYLTDLGKKALTPQIVLELHEILTRDTLDNPDAVGRLRLASEKVDVVDPENNVLHAPPPAEQLPDRLSAMCDFANGKTPEGFVHPVIRSILLHFWLAYDHPFVDGNGRCARSLFYWSMLQHDYWLFQYISISQIILKAPTQYARSFLYVETDDNDATYFIMHQLEVVKKAIDNLHRYLDEKLHQRRSLEAHLRLSRWLNDRQLELIQHAIRHPNAQYEVEPHMNNYGIAYETARKDLLGLADKNLLSKQKNGRTWVFFVPTDLENRLSKLDA